MTTGRAVVLIPARLQSTRLPGKPLLFVRGKALLEWTYERALRTKADAVVVASADGEVERLCTERGMPCVRTDPELPSGTHRCAEALGRVEGGPFSVAVNWQCDEPLVEPEYVNTLIDLVRSVRFYSDVATLVSPASDRDMGRREVVKAALSRDLPIGDIVRWFSRAPIEPGMAHTGVYAFRAGMLRTLGSLKPSCLSRAESLEQLTWLERGYEICAVRMRATPLSVNTPDDLEEFTRLVLEMEHAN